MAKKDMPLYSGLFVLLIAVIGVSCVMFTAALQYDRSRDWIGSGLHSVALMGEYSEEGGPWLPFTKDTTFDYIELRDITIRGHFTKDIPKGEKLFMNIDQLRVAMRINQVEVLRVQPVEGDGNPTKAIGKLWYSYISPGISQSDEIELNFGNLYRNAYMIQFDELLWGMRTGNERMFVFDALGQDQWLWGIGACFLFLSLFLMLLTLICAMLQIAGALQFLWLGFTSLFSALWFFTLAPSLSLLFPLPVFSNLIYSCSIQGIAIFATLFVVQNVTGWRKRSLLWCIGAIMVMLVIDMTRQIAGVQDLFSAINHFSILDILIAVWIIICLRYESSITANKEQLSKLMRAMVPLVVFGTLELLNGYIQFCQAAICFGLGLIVFVVLQSIYIMQKIKHTIQIEKKTLVLENELIQSRISVALSQIQPHFLYNSLTAIKSLCTSDPQRAKEAVVSFSNYLRGNLDSLSTDRLIPFKQELTHIETYLTLEKMRFGDQLQIIYDIAADNFTLPVLTVQPLIENAVRYGVTKKEGGGTITLTTQETKEAILIMITDDGIGFDTMHKKNDGEMHIGIENVRSRLKAQCSGTLYIESTPMLGTNATITIPKGGISNENHSRR